MIPGPGRYRRDRRVCRQGKGYTVTLDGADYRVLPTRGLGWSIFTGPQLDLTGYGYPNPEAAIRALLSNPPARR